MIKATAAGLDRALIHTLSPTRPVLADRLLPAASAAAQGSGLWLATAAGLAVLGGRRGRRAATEGVAAIAVTSVLVNGPLKRFAGRRRPGRGLAGVFVRTSGRAPRTSSMPSSHAAAGAAFAVAVGCSLPAAGPPVGLAAGLVAWSRVNARRHHPSDVVVGLAVGAAIGVVVHRVARRLEPAGSNET